MQIKVKTLTGKEIEFDIEPTDTVKRIKERVEEKEGIPPQQQVYMPKRPHSASYPLLLVLNPIFNKLARHSFQLYFAFEALPFSLAFPLSACIPLPLSLEAA